MGNVQIEEEFTGKNLTLFGGLGLVSKFFGGLRLCKTLRILDKQFPRRENGYEVSHLILALIYGLIVGKFRPYEISLALVNDKVFKKLTGLNSFPSQSTFSRFLSWVRLAVSEELSNINLRLLRQLRCKFKGYIQGLTIDLDSHVKTVYGNQEGANVGYNHKKRGRKSYHPLLAFIGETRDFVRGYFREGKAHTSIFFYDDGYFVIYGIGNNATVSGWIRDGYRTRDIEIRWHSNGNFMGKSGKAGDELRGFGSETCIEFNDGSYLFNRGDSFEAIK